MLLFFLSENKHVTVIVHFAKKPTFTNLAEKSIIRTQNYDLRSSQDLETKHSKATQKTKNRQNPGQDTQISVQRGFSRQWKSI